MPRTYSEKIDKLIESYNADQEKALEILNDNSNQYTKEYLQSEAIKKLQENFKAYDTKAQNFLKEFSKSLDNTTAIKAAKLYPALSSDNNKMLGQLQRTEAKTLLSNVNGNRSEIVSELDQSLQLKRFDFVSTLFDNLIIPDKDAILNLEESDFWNKVSELKDKYYKDRDVNDLIENITDLKDSAIPKINLLTNEIKKGNTYIVIPDPNTKKFEDQMHLASMENEKSYVEGIGGLAASQM